MFRIQFQLFDGWDLFLNFCFAVYIVFFKIFVFVCNRRNLFSSAIAYEIFSRQKQRPDIIVK